MWTVCWKTHPCTLLTTFLGSGYVRGRNYLPFASTCFHSRFSLDPCCSSCLFSVLCFVCLILPVYQGSPRYLVGSVLLILLVLCVVFCLFTLHVYQGSPRYLVGSVFLILLVFCVVFCLSYSSRVPGFS